MTCDKDSTHVLIRKSESATTRLKCERPTACSEGTCLGPIPLHLARRADYGLVQAQLASGSGELPLEPIVTDTAKQRPMYGAHFGTTYITRLPTFPVSASLAGLSRRSLAPREGNCGAERNDTDHHGVLREGDCGCLPWQRWRACLRHRLWAYGMRLRAASPYLTLAGDITDYLAMRNLQNAAEFPGLCRAGSVGRWGRGTCVPDLETSNEVGPCAAQRKPICSWARSRGGSGPAVG